MSRGHDELTTASVLKRDLHWETYVTARLISERDLQLIRRYDKRGNQVQTSLLEEVRSLCFCWPTGHLT